MEHQFRHGVGGAVDAPRRQEHEPTPAERAAQAGTVARNLDNYQQQVTAGISAMAAAQVDSDPAAWERGRKQAENGLKAIEQAVDGARAAKGDAATPDVAAKLGGAGELLSDMQARLSAAPARPERVAPTLSCAGDLLGSLPPDEPVSNAMQVYGEAERAVAAVFRGAMLWSDIQAFGELLASFPAHPIARRFARFGPERQQRLQAILKDSKVRARARAMEAARQQAAPLVAPPPGYRAAVTIDKPAEYEESRTTIAIGPGSEDQPIGADARTPETGAGARNAGGAVDRANGTTTDKPAEYEETRATIDVDNARTAEPTAAGDARRPEDAVARANGTAIDKPAEYEESRATIELEAADEATATTPARRRRSAGGDAREATTSPADATTAPAGESVAPVGDDANRVTAEPEIRALLAAPIAAHEIARLRDRKTRLLSLFGAIPTAERNTLRRRLNDPRDDLGRAFHGELSGALRRDLIATLDGVAVPLPGLADSVEMAAFATSITADRLLAPTDELILDSTWQATRPVTVAFVPGWGPPTGQASPTVQWRLLDRMGEVVQAGVVPWEAAMPVPAGTITVNIDQPGRWEVRAEIVDQGRVLSSISKPLRARMAAEDGSDLAQVIPSHPTEQLRAAQGMGNAELTDQIGALREQIGTYDLGPRDKEKDAEFARLRAVLGELEFEASTRVVDGEPLSTGEPVDGMALDMETVRAAPFEATPQQRATIQRQIDSLIATYGLSGAEARINELEQQLADDDASIHGGTVGSPMHSWLHDEFDQRKADAVSFLDRFDESGRTVAYGLLVESEGRLLAELERYGLESTDAPHGSFGTNGVEPGADLTALRDAVEHGKRIQAAHAKVLAASQQGTDGESARLQDEAWKEYEAEKLIAIAKHPMLRTFLEGDTQQAGWAPTGTTPGVLSVGDYQPEHFGKFMGWELNRKIGDNRLTQERISEGKLSIFAVPKVVDLAKQHMRVAPGSMLDGAVNERAAHPPDSGDWTTEMIGAISIALGLLLVIPSGGTSLGAGVALAGEVALLTADLYLLGKEMEQHAVYSDATNTDMSVAESLLQEEPSAGPLIFRILGVAGVAAGVGSVARSASDLARAVTRAREGIEAVRAVRRAAQEAGGELARPEVTAAIDNLRPIAREAGMTDDEIDALIRTVGRNAVFGTRGAALVSGTLDTGAEVTEAVAPVLARQLGVPRVVVSGEATRTVGVRPTLLHGRVVVEEVIAGRQATVADVLAHDITVASIGRYEGVVGRVRQTWDEIAEAAGAGPRVNPHVPFTPGHEAFEEVRKYEQFIRDRMGELAGHLARGGDEAAAAAARVEDEILLMEGELAHWRGVLQDVRRTGDAGLARGLIEGKDIGKVTDEAIAARYPDPPNDHYFYRRWPGGGPEGQEFQLVRKSSAGPEDLSLQPRREGDRWVLAASESGGKVPRSFAARLSDREVLDEMLDVSPSLKQYDDALQAKLGLDPGAVRARMEEVVQRVRSPRGATAEDVADGARRAIDEDNLRHALKQEFKEDFFRAAALEPTPEAAMRRFRENTAGLNPSDSGNMMEEFLHRRDAGSVRHVGADQATLGKQRPPVEMEQDRVIDRVRPDGTAVEVKSGSGELSDRELAQLEDYKRMASGGAVVDVNGTPKKVTGAMYEFTSPDGVRANLDTIAKRMLPDRVRVKVYNRSGESRTLTDAQDLDGLLEWLDR